MSQQSLARFLPLPTEHMDLESIGLSLRDLNLQFGIAFLIVPYAGNRLGVVYKNKVFWSNLVVD
jgi:hypothetical protein